MGAWGREGKQDGGLYCNFIKLVGVWEFASHRLCFRVLKMKMGLGWTLLGSHTLVRLDRSRRATLEQIVIVYQKFVFL